MMISCSRISNKASNIRNPHSSNIQLFRIYIYKFKLKNISHEFDVHECFTSLVYNMHSGTNVSIYDNRRVSMNVQIHENIDWRVSSLKLFISIKLDLNISLWRCLNAMYFINTIRLLWSRLHKYLYSSHVHIGTQIDRLGRYLHRMARGLQWPIDFQHSFYSVWFQCS